MRWLDPLPTRQCVKAPHARVAVLHHGKGNFMRSIVESPDKRRQVKAVGQNIEALNASQWPPEQRVHTPSVDDGEGKGYARQLTCAISVEVGATCTSVGSEPNTCSTLSALSCSPLRPCTNACRGHRSAQQDARATLSSFLAH